MANLPESLKDGPLKNVQLEALVVMKIIKQCTQNAAAPATGFLVGMDRRATLEVTNAFAFPTIDAAALAASQHDSYHDYHNNNNAAAAAAALAATAPRTKANTAYQNEMISKLHNVNVDANNVGWYTSADMGRFVQPSFIENQVHYQKEMNERTVALVHDVARTAHVGALGLRAFRLAPSFMAALKENKFTAESLQKSKLRFQDILVELPVHIHNSHLLTSFLHSLPLNGMPSTSQLGQNESNESMKNANDGDDDDPPNPSSFPTLDQLNDMPDPLTINFAPLNLSVDPFLEQTTDLLLDSIEAHHVELNNYQYYQRSLGREQVKIAAWQAKRKSENAVRALSKQDPLPEDEWQRLFKLPQEPSRLETILNSRQIEQYARQVDTFAATVSGKMFAVRDTMLPSVGGEE